MEKEIFLVRHGETDFNKELRYQGHMDVDLNQKGYLQAQKISKRLSTQKIDEVYSSDLKRAKNTAEVIVDPHNLKLNTRKGLREIDVGDWEGLTYDDLRKDYPDLIKKWYDNPISVSPPGGETLNEFEKRVVDCFHEIINQCQGEKIAIIAHGGTIRILLANLLEIPLNKNWQIEIHNTGLSIIKLIEKYPVIKLLNSTYHLD